MVHVRSIRLIYQPIVYYVCGMHMQGMCEIIYSKIAICENLTLALYGMQLRVTNCSYHVIY